MLLSIVCPESRDGRLRKYSPQRSEFRHTMCLTQHHSDDHKSLEFLTRRMRRILLIIGGMMSQKFSTRIYKFHIVALIRISSRELFGQGIET